ncbi:MAG: rhodanese-related sulfurtransferase [Saprospiraceae bacterium]|nr:rhodanese-related sulfurtransferase [Saprospiraceae bacterium]
MIEQPIGIPLPGTVSPSPRLKKALHNRVNRRELKQKLQESREPRLTLSFYKYTQIAAPQQFRDELYAWWEALGVLGRTYVAKEGINAQISVPSEKFEQFKTLMNSYEMFRGMRLNVAVEAEGKSFFALIIKVKDKIVADGIDDPDFDPSKTGVHLNAEEWNRLSDDPDSVIVDMRNHYESEVGHFEGAITPDVATFREELPLVTDLLADQKERKILMYCTGGIRCEKASAYLKHKGFKNVFQLEGGIIEYDRQVRAKGLKNKFLGKNFVFDERLGERISPDVIAYCHQCETPADTHTNCANPYCHILFIQCEGCREKMQGCCSEKCRDFNLLSPEDQKERAPGMVFNGTKFGKGAYKAFRKAGGNLSQDF